MKEQLFLLMGQVEQHFILLHTALQARCLQLLNSLALAAESQATELQTIVSVPSTLQCVMCVLCVYVVQCFVFAVCMFTL